MSTRGWRPTTGDRVRVQDLRTGHRGSRREEHFLVGTIVETDHRLCKKGSRAIAIKHDNHNGVHEYEYPSPFGIVIEPHTAAAARRPISAPPSMRPNLSPRMALAVGDRIRVQDCRTGCRGGRREERFLVGTIVETDHRLCKKGTRAIAIKHDNHNGVHEYEYPSPFGIVIEPLTATVARRPNTRPIGAPTSVRPDPSPRAPVRPDRLRTLRSVAATPLLRARPAPREAAPAAANTASPTAADVAAPAAADVAAGEGGPSWFCTRCCHRSPLSAVVCSNASCQLPLASHGLRPSTVAGAQARRPPKRKAVFDPSADEARIVPAARKAQRKRKARAAHSAAAQGASGSSGGDGGGGGRPGPQGRQTARIIMRQRLPNIREAAEHASSGGEEGAKRQKPKKRPRGNKSPLPPARVDAATTSAPLAPTAPAPDPPRRLSQHAVAQMLRESHAAAAARALAQSLAASAILHLSTGPAASAAAASTFEARGGADDGLSCCLIMGEGCREHTADGRATWPLLACRSAQHDAREGCGGLKSCRICLSCLEHSNRGRRHGRPSCPICRCTLPSGRMDEHYGLEVVAEPVA